VGIAIVGIMRLAGRRAPPHRRRVVRLSAARGESAQTEVGFLAGARGVDGAGAEGLRRSEALRHDARGRVGVAVGGGDDDVEVELVLACVGRGLGGQEGGVEGAADGGFGGGVAVGGGRGWRTGAALEVQVVGDAVFVGGTGRGAV
jgi:hypothetical protein